MGFKGEGGGPPFDGDRWGPERSNGRLIEPGLWETRSRVPDGIVRTLFTVDGDVMVLLHGFVKKTQKIPERELSTARTRLRQYQEGGL